MLNVACPAVAGGTKGTIGFGLTLVGESLGYERLQRLPDYYTQYEDNDAFQYAKTLAAPLTPSP